MLNKLDFYQLPNAVNRAATSYFEESLTRVL